MGRVTRDPGADQLLPDDIGVRPHEEAVAVDLDAPIPVPADVALFATDVDGTLLGSDLRLGEYARAAIPAAVAAGIEFVYVTGRPPRWLIPVVAETGHAGLAVCANGALLIDLAQERLLRATTLSPDLARETVLWLRSQFPGISFAIERTLPGAASATDLARFTVVGFEPAYDPPWASRPDTERGDVLELLTRGQPVKLLGAPPPGVGLTADELLAHVSEHFGSRLHVTHSGTRNLLIEIMPGEVDKGVGLAEVAEMKGIPHAATLAVGDMPNDLPMLRWAATSYAVANAHAGVRAIADHVIPSNDDDGVGRLLGAVLAGQGR